MSAFRKDDRKDIFEHIKYQGHLNPHYIKELIEIIEDHEKRLAELEDSTRLEKLINELVKECIREYG